MMVSIRNFEKNDFDVIMDIYQQGIDAGEATFETQVKEWDEWNNAMLKVCRLVAVENTRVVGWAACTRKRGRPSITFYVGQSVGERGVLDTPGRYFSRK
jgi:phosphinothricin acetyltransferase